MLLPRARLRVRRPFFFQRQLGGKDGSREDQLLPDGFGLLMGGFEEEEKEREKRSFEQCILRFFLPPPLLHLFSQQIPPVGKLRKPRECAIDTRAEAPRRREERERKRGDGTCWAEAPAASAAEARRSRRNIEFDL